MPLQIQTTEDGSHTLFWEEKNEHYHSTHGAIQEARKVYLETALEPALQAARQEGRGEVNIFEMGFGTGLNTLLTLLYAQEDTASGISINYTAIEANPLPEPLWRQLNYSKVLNLPDNALLETLHRQPFDGLPHEITTRFTLTKIEGRMQDTVLPSKHFHAVYYDAFAPQIQPELWELPIFEKLNRASALPCYLATYCAQGAFKRTLKAAGFEVRNLPGPVGKREITQGRL